MPDIIAPDDYRDPIHVRIKDAFGWAYAMLVNNATNLPQTWREASPRERFRLVLAVLLVASFVFTAIVEGGLWLWLLVALWVIAAGADLDDVTTSVADRRRYLRLMAAKPTGAPRVAEIRCSKGVTHRFLYGPGGWEEAGPAMHPVPDA